MTDQTSTPRHRTLFVELHALRSFAPSNLNRDELGTPKTAVFGGHRRLRISSQCLKRTWRTSPFFQGALADELLGVRTQHLPDVAGELLQKDAIGGSISQEAADGLVALLQTIGTKGKKAADDEDEDDDDAEAGAAEAADTAAKETAHLLFLSKQEIAEVKAFARDQKSALADLFEKKKGKNVANTKKVEAMRKKLGEHLAEKCKRNAVDVALFGRFITSAEIKTVDAALQVAHALGTQKVEVEYDYFSAVDDWGEGHAAGHIGESEFASSVFYQYAICDFGLLTKNLDGDRKLAAQSIKAIVLALARAVPKGKKNSTAPQSPADYVEVIVRRDPPVSLANAFLKPVAPDGKHDVMDRSIQELQRQGTKYVEAYGADVVGRFVLCLRDGAGDGTPTLVTKLDDLAAKAEATLLEHGAHAAVAEQR